jgi:hypothetical protein
MRAALLAALIVAPAWAEAPATSIRPQPRAPIAADDGSIARPDARPANVAVAATPLAPQRSLRPVARPQVTAQPAPVPAAPPPAAEAETEVAPRRGLLASLFGPPRARPAPEERSAPAAGYVCGDPAIIGKVMDPIGNPSRGCGVAEPVQVTMVDGIRLSQAATMDCPTAQALHRWIDDGLRPAFRGREIVQLQIAAHYICRTRNNRPGARISEHGRGRAIDIAGITFADGETDTVAGDYGRAMRAAHRAACGIFGTTLGPGSDGYHEDHLHFDTARHSNGPYCR